MFWTHHSLAELFHDENKFEDAHVHIEQAKSHTVDDPYSLGRAMKIRARILCRQNRLKEATDEVLGALEIFENLGATELESCRTLLREIRHAAKSRSTSDIKSDSDCEPLPTIRCLAFVDPPFLEWCITCIAPRPSDYTFGRKYRV